jgi:hypothetical protein
VVFPTPRNSSGSDEKRTFHPELPTESNLEDIHCWEGSVTRAWGSGDDDQLDGGGAVREEVAEILQGIGQPLQVAAQGRQEAGRGDGLSGAAQRGEGAAHRRPVQQA